MDTLHQISEISRGTVNQLTVDLDRAEAFLNTLGERHTFQTFDDAKKNRKFLVRVLSGAFRDVANELVRLNDLGAGIFVTVNETNGRGRLASDIVRVRALFVDADGTAAPKTWHRTPDIFVWRDAPESEQLRSGLPLCRWHAYWLATTPIPLDKFTESQTRLAAHYGTDPAIKDLPRVMRVPGFIHRKAEPQELYLERY